MKRTDFNAPIEGRSALIESPLHAREVTRCLRWDEERHLHEDEFGEPLQDGIPDVYFPLDNSYQESTGGGRIWTPSGAVNFQQNRVYFGGLNPLVPTEGIISMPASARSFDLDFTESWTIRCKIGFYVFTTFTPVVTRLVFKGDEATFGYHGAIFGDDGPTSGWTIAVTQQDSASGSTAFRNVDLWIGGAAALRVSMLPLVLTVQHVVLYLAVVFDVEAQTVTAHLRGGLNGNIKIVRSTVGASFDSNTDPLNASSQSSSGFVQTSLDEMGFWHYAWDDDQVDCDYANSYTWP